MAKAEPITMFRAPAIVALHMKSATPWIGEYFDRRLRGVALGERIALWIVSILCAVLLTSR